MKMPTVALAGAAALAFAGITAVNLSLTIWQASQGNFRGGIVVTVIFVLPAAALCFTAAWVPFHLRRVGKTLAALVAAAIAFGVAAFGAFLEMFMVSG